MASNQVLEQSLHQTLAALEAQRMDKRRLKGLLIWYAQNHRGETLLDSLLANDETEPAPAQTATIEQERARLAGLLEEMTQMSPEVCYETIAQLSVEDMVRFSVLQEFGAGFSKKRCYQLLVRCIEANLMNRFPASATPA